ncbi:MAG TPA: hypothetical protein PK857_00290 [Hyphomicrobium sp.]|nr:hypothetical protein [Hyphomicrobium sp.]
MLLTADDIDPRRSWLSRELHPSFVVVNYVLRSGPPNTHPLTHSNTRAKPANRNETSEKLAGGIISRRRSLLDGGAFDSLPLDYCWSLYHIDISAQFSLPSIVSPHGNPSKKSAIDFAAENRAFHFKPIPESFDID